MDDLEIASITGGTINRTGDGVTPVVVGGLAALMETADFQKCRVPVALTAAATLAISAKNNVVTLDCGATATITVPPETDVAWPDGTRIDLVRLNATYEITIAAGSGVTIRSSSSQMRINAQYSAVTLRKLGTNLWVLSGDKKV